MKPFQKSLIFFLFFIVFSATSCVGRKEKSLEFQYIEAIDKLEKRSYLQAIEEFEELYDDYPFSKWSIKGKVMISYAYYKLKMYDELLVTIGDFEQNNPNHVDMPYVQYLKAMSYYNRISNIYASQDYALEALYSFKKLNVQFSESIYVEDSKKKQNEIKEHMALSAMIKAKYDLRSSNYIGFIRKIFFIIKNYERTSQAPEAHYRLIEVYYKIGLVDLAKEVFAEMEKKYSGSKWCKNARLLLST